jgi:hypothetical protein
MNGQDEKREREIVERARQLFAESVQGVDGATRSKLAQARAKAVEAASKRSRRWWLAPSALVPVGGVAAAALAVALIWQNPEIPAASMQSTVISDLDILLEGEELDLFEELDFYAWLLEQPEILDAGESADGSG